MIESEQHSERAELAMTHASVYAQKETGMPSMCACADKLFIKVIINCFKITQTRLLKKQREESVYLIYVLKRISKWLSVFKWFNH